MGDNCIFFFSFLFFFFTFREGSFSKVVCCVGNETASQKSHPHPTLIKMLDNLPSCIKSF